MQKHSLNAVVQATGFLAIASVMFASPPPEKSTNAQIVHPTPVAGESWLRHLHRSFDETSMGKTGRLGPADDWPSTAQAFEGGQASPAFEIRDEAWQEKKVVLHGLDLYRMNCRGCHGETGAGAPPEINSVINPVRATSTEVIMERVKATGASLSRADAAMLAQQSKTMLLDRLHHGGQDMPSFPHLSETEIKALVAYLRQLAGVGGVESEQLALREDRMHIGEHIAKSTCHTCHSAAGPNPTAQELYEGAIPPLSTLTLRTNRAQFVRKVTQGAPIKMGEPLQTLRGRMPVFYYLSEDEAADVYLYLMNYPPYPYAVLDAAAAASQGTEGGGTGDTTGTPAETIRDSAVYLIAEERAAGSRVVDAPTNGRLASISVFAGIFVALALGIGLIFTGHELRRLAQDQEPDGRNRGEISDDADERRNPELVA